MKINKQTLNKPVILLFIIAILFALFFHPWTDTYTRSLISWDKLGYYLYLPNLFIYKDWHNFDFATDYFIKYQPSNTWYQTLFLPDLRSQVITYSLGLTFFQLPFFLLGHLSAYIFHYPLDGFSKPYVFWVYISGLFYCLAGLFLCYKILSNFFSKKYSWVIVILLLLSTNLVFYGMVDTIMPHSYLFFLFSLLLYSTIKWHEKQTFLYTLLICISIGLMISIRATDIIAAIIPLLYGINIKAGLKNKLLLIKNNYGKIIVSIILGSIPFLLQMYYWYFATGQWLFNPYGYSNFGFNWLHPHLFDFLFSFRKGWFTYTPVMFISIAGLYYMRNTKLKILLPGLIIFLIANIYILSSWEFWYFGGSYGQRPMVQSYAFLIIPFAAALKAFNKKKILRIGAGLFITICLYVNLLNVWIYKNDLMLADGMTFYMCKENLLHPFAAFIPESKRIDRYTWKNEYIQPSEIMFSDTAEKTMHNGDFLGVGNWNGGEISSKPFQWVRCTYETRFLSMADNLPSAAVLVSEVQKPNGAIGHWKGKSFTDQFEKKGNLSGWMQRTVDFRIPVTLHPNDTYKVYFWLIRDQMVYVRNVRLLGIEVNQ